MKPKLAAALGDLHAGEAELGREHRAVADRHAADHDVFHICHSLARQCDGHAEQIRSALSAAGHEAPEEGHDGPPHAVIATVRRKASEAMGRSDQTGALLLHDLRHLYALASDVEIGWTIVGQGAKAARELELVGLFSTGREEVAGQLRWIKTRIKLTAPQVLTVG